MRSGTILGNRERRTSDCWFQIPEADLPRSPWFEALAITLFAFGAGSCGGDHRATSRLLGISPAVASQGLKSTATVSPRGELFPLVAGSRWHYAVTIRRTWLPTSEFPDSVTISHDVSSREI